MVWYRARNIFNAEPFGDLAARRREQELNPAYRPQYSGEDLEKSCEHLAVVKEWNFRGGRPVESFAPLRFLTSLESVVASTCEVTDLSPLAALPALRKLTLGSLGHDFGNPRCEDFSPLGECLALKDLTLGFTMHWPNLNGIEKLQQLEALSLGGNLLAMPRGAIFPKVRRAALHCVPLAARNVEDLPQLPSCEFLTLSGAERLDGIERMPGLRNLTINGPFRSFAPLVALKELTWLVVDGNDERDLSRQPRDVAPLSRLPKLLYFQIGPAHVIHDMPRDYSPLAEAPALRQLVVRQCPPVEMEVAALNAGLQPWDDLFPKPEPQPLPALRMVVGPAEKRAWRGEEHRSPDEPDLIDTGLRECETRWVKTFAERKISDTVGNVDWGKLDAFGSSRNLFMNIESFDVVEKLPVILDGLREVMAALRHEYSATFMIGLKVRPPEPTPAQKQLDQKLRDAQDDWDYEQHRREKAEYLERLHQLELKQQQGAEINPDEFSPPERAAYPEMAEESDDDADDFDNENDDGEIAVDAEPEPTFGDFDDEHPLAASYNLIGYMTLEEVWFLPHHQGIASHLMMRTPDLVLSKDE